MTLLNKPFLHHLIFFLSIFIAYPPVVIADKILLRNGRSLEGLIKKETASHVVLSVAGGSISIHRADIKSILETEVKPARNSLIEFDYPEQLTNIAVNYKKLKKDRLAAKRVKTKQSKNKRKMLLKHYSSEQQRSQMLVKKLKSVNPNHNVTKYNSLIAQLNHSRANLFSMQTELSDDMKEQATGKKVISEYIKQLASLREQVEKSKLTLVDIENKELAITFWGQLDKKLNQFDSEFKIIEVPHKSTNGHMILDVHINNSTTGRFLLDTGASYVTLSQEMAKRLNMKTDHQQGVALTIADGSTISGKPVILNSMRVGNVQAEHVKAVILPHPPAEGIDGLLGMSFLREFIISFDPGNNKLIFKRFAPIS